jgi:hypothetical protein
MKNQIQLLELTVKCQKYIYSQQVSVPGTHEITVDLQRLSMWVYKDCHRKQSSYVI